MGLKERDWLFFLPGVAGPFINRKEINARTTIDCLLAQKVLLLTERFPGVALAALWLLVRPRKPWTVQSSSRFHIPWAPQHHSVIGHTVWCV